VELPCRVSGWGAMAHWRSTGWFLRTIYEVFIPESSHFNSNQHSGIRVSPRMIVRVNVARAKGDSEGSDEEKEAAT
jgi:hypothetical protein